MVPEPEKSEALPVAGNTAGDNLPEDKPEAGDNKLVGNTPEDKPEALGDNKLVGNNC
jgi:hypothetical protein